MLLNFFLHYSLLRKLEGLEKSVSFQRKWEDCIKDKWKIRLSPVCAVLPCVASPAEYLPLFRHFPSVLTH